jgi:hypothetical protein
MLVALISSAFLLYFAPDLATPTPLLLCDIVGIKLLESVVGDQGYVMTHDRGVGADH